MPKTEVLAIRTSPDNTAAIKSLAAAEGLSVGAFIERVLSEQYPDQIHRTTRKQGALYGADNPRYNAALHTKDKATGGH